MEESKKWSRISFVVLSVGFLTILAGGLTDVYNWGNPVPVLITGGVIFVSGIIVHRIKG